MHRRSIEMRQQANADSRNAVSGMRHGLGRLMCAKSFHIGLLAVKILSQRALPCSFRAAPGKRVGVAP